MTDQSLFEDNKPQNSGQPQKTPAEGVQTASSDPSLEDLLGQIKNESGERKYDSLPKALDGLRHAQEYIPQLKSELSAKDQELQKLREELSKRESVEDVVSRLTAQKAEESQPAPQGLDEQSVEALVQSALQKQQTASQEATNLQQVNSALVERYGSAESAKQAIAKKAEELGISASEIGELAKRSPKAVLAYFPAQSSQDVSPSKGSVSTSQFTYAKNNPELPRPSKSLLSGATSREQMEHMQRIKEKVYADLGITN